MVDISLKEGKLGVVNLGLEMFANDLKVMGIEAVQVDWKPPIETDPHYLMIIDQSRDRIEHANRKALEIIQAGKARLTGLDLARNVIPGMQEDMILHAGPPVTWDRMCGPMKGAVIGALIYEGKAANYEEAEALAASGGIEFSPCHEHDAVGPMAGVVSASMPVFIIRNETYGNYAYCTQNEGLGKVLRYGAYSAEVITRLHWMADVLYPLLDMAIRDLGGIDISNIIMQALQMGDEVHNRNRAGTSLLFRQLAPALIRLLKEPDILVAFIDKLHGNKDVLHSASLEVCLDSRSGSGMTKQGSSLGLGMTSADKPGKESKPLSVDPETIARVLEFINGNDHFFLNLSMPACKCILDAARGIDGSSIVIAMARNGTDFGIHLSGTGNAWFTGKALVPEALYFPGYDKEDANPDIGDSAITETGGLGGFAIAAAPAIVQFVGGNASEAIKYTQMMYDITYGESKSYQIPGLDFRGSPLGIDVRKVIETGIFPFIDTGVAHRNAGVGQIGAGVVQAPQEPFIQAFRGLAKQLEKEIKS